MEKHKEKFDHQQHSRCIAIYLDDEYIYLYNISNRERFDSIDSMSSSLYSRERACCIYDPSKNLFSNWGEEALAQDAPSDKMLFLDGFSDKLYKIHLDVFVAKIKSITDQDVYYLISGVKHILYTSVNNVRERLKDKVRYIFVVSTHWDCAIREKLLRPIFIETGLVKADDHLDRLQFSTKLECLVRLFQTPEVKQETPILFQKMKEFRHCLLYECDISSNDRTIITLTSFEAQNLDISTKSLLIPKSKKSVASFLVPDIDRATKDFEEYLISIGVIGIGNETMTPKQIEMLFIRYLESFVTNNKENNGEELYYDDSDEEINNQDKCNKNDTKEYTMKKLKEMMKKIENVTKNIITKTRVKNMMNKKEDNEQENCEESDEEGAGSPKSVSLQKRMEAFNGLKLTKSQQKKLSLITTDKLNEVMFAPYTSDIISSFKEALNYDSTRKHILLPLMLTSESFQSNYGGKTRTRYLFLRRVCLFLIKEPIFEALAITNLIIVKENAVIIHKHILYGALQNSAYAIKQSDVESPPLFIKEERNEENTVLPNIILHIDLSFSKTLCTFTLLNEDGIVTHYSDDIASFSNLKPLNRFFAVDFKHNTPVLTLKVEQRYIWLVEFMEEHFSDSLDFFSNYNQYVKATDDEEKQTKYFKTRNRASFINRPCNNFANMSSKEIAIIDDVFSADCNGTERTINVMDQSYIKTLLVMYVGFLKQAAIERIKTKLEIKLDESTIGYTIAIEQILVEKYDYVYEEFEEIAYASGLLSKDEKNDDKRLHIFVQGEDLFSTIQSNCKVKLPVKSFYSQVQLYDNYMHISINQIVNNTEEEAATITVKRKVLVYEDLYAYMAKKMWRYIQQDENKEFMYCSTHVDNSKWQESMFSLDNVSGFKVKFMEFVNENLINLKSQLELDSKKKLIWCNNCSCSVYTTLRNVIELAICPAFEDTMTSALATMDSVSLFGDYSVRHIHFISCLSDKCIDGLFKNTMTEKLQHSLSNHLDLKEVPTQYTVLSLNVYDLFVSHVGDPSVSFGFFKHGRLRQIVSQDLGLTFQIDGYNREDYDIIFKIDRTTMPRCKTSNFILRRGELVTNDIVTIEFIIKCNCKIRTKAIRAHLTTYRILDHNISNEDVPDEKQSKHADAAWNYIKYFRRSKSKKMWKKNDYINVTADITMQNWSSDLKVSVQIEDDYDSYFDVDIHTRPIYLAEPLIIAYI